MKQYLILFFFLRINSWKTENLISSPKILLEECLPCLHLVFAAHYLEAVVNFSRWMVNCIDKVYQRKQWFMRLQFLFLFKKLHLLCHSYAFIENVTPLLSKSTVLGDKNSKRVFLLFETNTLIVALPPTNNSYSDKLFLLSNALSKDELRSSL